MIFQRIICTLILTALFLGTRTGTCRADSFARPDATTSDQVLLGWDTATLFSGTIYSQTPWSPRAGLGAARIDLLDKTRLHTIGTVFASTGYPGQFSFGVDADAWVDSNCFMRVCMPGYGLYQAGAALRRSATMPFTATLRMDELMPTSSIANDPTAVQSPNGDVPSGTRAFAPNGLLYATEVAPYSQGNIGIFRLSDDQQVGSIKVRQTAPLKGLAWSRDSRFVAVIYHGGMYDTGITLWDATTGQKVRDVGPGGDHDRWYHAMVFSLDNAHILIPSYPSISQRYLTGLASPVRSFIEFSGCNLPWIRYGWDVGTNPWGGPPGGFASNTARLEDDLRFLAEHGVKVVRVFIFCDLRSAVIFDEQGYPLGFDEYALGDFEVLVNAVAKHKMKLIPVLFDYMLADGVSQEGNCAVGEHPDLITDPAKRDALISLFCRYIFDRYRGLDSIIPFWEVMSEPENASAVYLDHRAELTEFIRQFNMAIRSTGFNTKAGCGSNDRSAVASWAATDPGVYSFHYYDAMEPTLPFDYPAASLNLDRMVYIGEAQPTDVSTKKMQQACDNGYLGLLFWSLNAADGFDFRAVADEYKSWVDSHREMGFP